VDGSPTSLGGDGISLGSGGRISKTPASGGIAIDFPDQTRLTVTPGFWGAPHNLWYLNVEVANTPAREGIMGAIPQGDWLPLLSNGKSLGAIPASLHQRYLDLNQTFADTWRVTDATSLFDYGTGTSTASFTLSNWPPENPPCVIPESRVPPAQPADKRVAEKLCSRIADTNMRAECVFDVTVTGEAGFAGTYLRTQQVRPGATETAVQDGKDPSKVGGSVSFTATVVPVSGGGKPTGTVQFTLDGAKLGNPVSLDSSGRAAVYSGALGLGLHQVSAKYTPDPVSDFKASISEDENHTVIEAFDFNFWLIVLLLAVILILIIWGYLRSKSAANP